MLRTFCLTLKLSGKLLLRMIKAAGPGGVVSEHVIRHTALLVHLKILFCLILNLKTGMVLTEFLVEVPLF